MTHKETILSVFDMRDQKGKTTFSKTLTEQFNEALFHQFDSLVFGPGEIKIFGKTLALIQKEKSLFISPIKEVISVEAKEFINDRINNPKINKDYILKLKAEKKSSLLENMINLRQEFMQLFGSDPFYNYNYREMMVESKMQQIEPSYERVSSKIDFITNKIEWGEVKSSLISKNKGGTYSSGNFQFDKQNDSIRRENTLKNDGYVFAPFEEGNESNGPLFLLYIKSKNGVKYIHELIKEKQKEFIKEQKNAEKDGTQLSRDTIQFNCIEILNCPDIECFDQSLTKLNPKEILSQFTKGDV